MHIALYDITKATNMKIKIISSQCLDKCCLLSSQSILEIFECIPATIVYNELIYQKIKLILHVLL